VKARQHGDEVSLNIVCPVRWVVGKKNTGLMISVDM
jgi:hypothetical protein